LSRRLGPRLERREVAALGAASLVLAGDPGTHRWVRSWCGEERALVLPSGLCTRYFSPRRSVIDPSNVLFFGSLSNPTQRDALVHLHRDIMPQVRHRLRHAHLTVVGSDPIQELAGDSDASLHFTGPIDDDRTAMWHAGAAALPLRFGTGSPQRLAQLLAMGIPVVASPAAVRGLDLRSGEGVLVAANDDEFVATLTAVLVDSSLRDDLSRRGREVAEERLSLAATYGRVSDLLARDLHAA
jgi:glycosyltransferase involved in cell wall biosynthesis